MARKQLIKRSEGFNSLDLRIPKRLMETPTPLGKISESYIREALERFSSMINAMQNDIMGL